jgi:hypothetical protein
VVVFAIVAHVVPPFVEDSHLMTDPVCPLSVIVPEAEPVHAVVTAGESVPPTDSGLTVTVTVIQFEL